MKFFRLEPEPAGHIGYQQRVKEANIKQIFDLVRSGRCTSRAQLVRAMELSATSVSGLVEELSARGLITETGPQQTSQPGRRPISLRFNGDARQVVVFTINREGVRYTLLNLNCDVLEGAFAPVDTSQLDPIDAGDTYGALFEDILKRRARRFDAARAALIGISFSGHYLESERAIVLRTNMDTSVSEAAMRRLQRRLGLPMCFANRTMCMAYAEKKRMDADNPDSPETQDLLYVAIGHDISGALVYDGNLFFGRHGIPGVIGHISIDHQGRPCPCGNAGCLERYVNLDAILADAQAACRAAGAAEPASPDELAARYPSEPAVAAALDRSADLLACGLYSALCATGVRKIVLGGGVEALGEDFLRRIDRSLCARNLFIRSLDLSYAKLGPESDSIGLAQYFLDKHYTITL